MFTNALNYTVCVCVLLAAFTWRWKRKMAPGGDSLVGGKGGTGRVQEKPEGR